MARRGSINKEVERETRQGPLSFSLQEAIQIPALTLLETELGSDFCPFCASASCPELIPLRNIHVKYFKSRNDLILPTAYLGFLSWLLFMGNSWLYPTCQAIDITA